MKTTIEIPLPEAEKLLTQSITAVMQELPSGMINGDVTVRITRGEGYQKISAVTAMRDAMRKQFPELAGRNHGGLKFWKDTVEAVIAASGLA